tara:strand:+ start:425 stop:1156 length:732 start_codon:yes stop_codon:yes gene_type:complete
MSKLRICNSADVPSNGMRAYEVDGGQKILIANAGDSYYAYQGLCPHQEVCLDEGFYDGKVLTCHKHLWQWDIITGKALGLAESPLEGYTVEVENGEIFVVQSSTLKMAELFANISSSVFDQLDRLACRSEYEAGHSLYNFGDLTDDIYIFESGRIEFLVGRDTRTKTAGFMDRKGEIFGWSALLEQQPHRIATATCLEKSVLLRLNGKEVLNILASEPESGFRVMSKLAALITQHLTLTSINQ